MQTLVRLLDFYAFYRSYCFSRNYCIVRECALNRL